MCAIAFVEIESRIHPTDPHERQRIERRRFLKQRVVETLALKPPRPCPLLKGSEHRTYKLSPDEEEREIRDYLRRSRQVRIMQVRAQEMLLAAQRVGDFRQRKKNEKHKLLRVLKEAWQEEHRRRIADVEENLVTSCRGIGQSHNAAQEVIKNMATMAEEKVKQAEENRLWETLRYQKAKQEECTRKSETAEVDKLAAAKGRRRVVECAAEIERTRARCRAAQAKLKSTEDKPNPSEEIPQTYLHPHFDSHDMKRHFIQSRLAGTPNDYKDTYFHSRFCVLKDKTNLNNTIGAHEDEEQHKAETNAWEATEAHLKKFELEQQRKAEIEEMWNKRKLERGQQAEAQLQKIALLEEELAMEVEQERERKHQLQLIEELSKAAHASTYKPAQRRHLDPKPNVNAVVEDKSAAKNREPSDSKAADCSGILQADPAEPTKSETTQPLQQMEAGTGMLENNIEQVSNPAQDAGISFTQSTQDTNRKVGHSDGKDDEFFDAQDTEIVDVRIEAPEPSRQPLTQVKILNGGLEMKIDPPSPPTNKNGAPLHRKGPPNQGRLTVNQESTGPSKSLDPNPTSRTSKVQIPRVPIKAQKRVSSTPQVSSLPNASASNNIRKGNKSPQRLNSLDRAASNGLENQGTVDQVTDAGRPRGRQTTPSTKAPEKKSALRATARTMEVCTNAEGKKTPRKHNGTWLANVLQKLTWWKSQKGLPIDEVCTPQDPVASENFPVAGRHSAKPFNREVRKESTPKFPVKQVDPPARSRAVNKSLPPLSKNFESTNCLAQSESETDKEPGWYEACTKDVFSAEELEALQLELYGTWTDGNASLQNNAKSKKDKAKPGQQDNDSDILNQQGHNRQRKGESKEKMAGNCNSDRIAKDPTVLLDDGNLNSEHVTGAKSSNKLLEKTPVVEVACEAPPVRAVDQRELEWEHVQRISSPTLPEGSHRADVQSQAQNQVSNSDKVTKKSECERSGEPVSARDVAEKLIQAWQTGQLGGTPIPISNHSKQPRFQGARKRRAPVDESLTDCSVPGISRRKTVPEAQHVPAKKVEKWEIPISWPQSSVPKKTRIPKGNGVIQSQENSRNKRTSPKIAPNFTVQHSPAQFKTEVSQNSRMQDAVPEARSLDYILSSLSTQVRELDERLRNVTSGAIHSSLPEERYQDEEKKLQSNFQKEMNAPSSVKNSQITDHANMKSSCCENQNCTTTGSSPTEQEKLSPRATSVKSPRPGGKMVFKGDFLINTLRSQAGSTCWSGDRPPKSVQEELSPLASMASCLDNISDLMKEMSRSPVCDTIAPQTPERSSVESIPKRPQSIPTNGIIELNSTEDNNRSVGAKGSEQPHGTAKKCKETFDVPSRVFLKSSAELCSGVLHRQTDGDPRCPLPCERASLSTINLEEAMSLDEIEEQLLLSGSVDFSPWNTEKLPDVFSSIANVAKSMNDSVEQDDNGPPDVDCDGTLKPVYCHVKRESEWLLRGNKLRGKSKAYEKRKAWKARGKQKKSPKRAFNPVALPPRHSTPRKHSSPRRPSTATIQPKVSTTRIQPNVPLPVAFKFQKKELKLPSDGSSKQNLTTRSLPTQFPGSVTAEEVQKWLRREAAISCAALSPVGTPSRGSCVASTARHQVTSYKRPDLSESMGGHQLKLMAQTPLRIPDLGLRDSNIWKKTLQPLVESRRRPASAGTVLKR